MTAQRTLLFLLPFLALCCAGQVATPVKTFQQDEGVVFELAERTRLPHYWWPTTLLSYPVRFPEATVRAGDLVLTNAETRDVLPFQLTGVQSQNGFISFATVHFLADLPSGGTRRFVLSSSPGNNSPATMPAVKAQPETAGITLDNGLFQIRIPHSQAFPKVAPGPIAAVARNGIWMGGGEIVSPKRQITGIETERLETGPLFTSYRVTYNIAGGASYVADLRMIAGYDHVQLREEVKGISRQEDVYWNATWANFTPSHRHAPNHPYLSRSRKESTNPYGDIPWERIDERFVNSQHGVSAGMSADGEMPFRLGVYQPWGAYIILTSACFWDERSGNSLGVFIDRVEDWQDHEYAIWSASNTLQLRYFYKNGTLSWRWPLVTGTRSTGIAVYDHRKDVEAVERLVTMSKADNDPDGLKFNINVFPASHTQFLQNRHGTVDLNHVKDWVLSAGTGPKNPGKVFPEGDFQTTSELLRTILTGELAEGITTSGSRQNAGFSPVPARRVYESFTDGIHRLWNGLSGERKERLSAWYLLYAYAAAGEDWMPMQTMLSGHPNFLSDVKSDPALAAFLFPGHPMAQEWADLFEKYLDLNTRYHTRPSVGAWEAKGGRWTENLGTYLWAFLRPAVRAEFALRTFVDGKNRMANPRIAQIGDWAVNALSAPFDGEDISTYRDSTGTIPAHYWGIVSKEKAPRRLHPPQGAHSARRMPPRVLWWIGDSLRNYTPLLAESMMWAARPTDEDSEFPKNRPDPWKIMYPAKDNLGTNPHLQSSKYTGYGITLRSGVDQLNETSVHLQQIDEGPNYRWGIAGEGGCGVIYYYAAGKSYSHNGREDVGDRPAHDTDFSTNFGVWKDGRFKSIGRNVLERPLLDLGQLQFAEILPRTGAGAYSWPEYKSRSVLMAGTDYFVVYDDVFNEAVSHRFSWATHIKEDFPEIVMVKGGVRDRKKQETRLETAEIRGAWHDGLGDSMAIVSHNKGMSVQPQSYGATVKLEDGTDYIFRNPDGIDISTDGIAFQGTAGIVRQRTGDRFELALFQGTRIAAGGGTFVLDGKDAGLSSYFEKPEESRGIYYARNGATLTISCANCATGTRFYLDGASRNAKIANGSVEVTLPPGRRHWQLTAGLPTPNAPVVLHTENASAKATIVWDPVPGADRYRVELSESSGKTWLPAGETRKPPFVLDNLQNGTKYHVRVIAANERYSSVPGSEYPVYAGSETPPNPDGLRLAIADGKVSLSWGEVLGVSRYHLYRRRIGEAQFHLVYSGTGRHFIDEPPGIVNAFKRPGILANALRDQSGYVVHEYAVSAENGNGEGKHSAVVTTDPASWANWDPRPGEPFRRRYTYNTTNYQQLGTEEDYSRYYPQ